MANLLDIPARAVLIVEDDVFIRMDTAQIVAQAGYVVYEAVNAEQAIALLEKHDDIRVVITDIVMPGSMDGYKLALAIRDRWPPISIILASGLTQSELGDMPRSTQFIAKPWAEGAITEALLRALEPRAA